MKWSRRLRGSGSGPNAASLERTDHTASSMRSVDCCSVAEIPARSASSSTGSSTADGKTRPSSRPTTKATGRAGVAELPEGGHVQMARSSAIGADGLPFGALADESQRGRQGAAERCRVTAARRRLRVATTRRGCLPRWRSRPRSRGIRGRHVTASDSITLPSLPACGTDTSTESIQSRRRAVRVALTREASRISTVRSGFAAARSYDRLSLPSESP